MFLPCTNEIARLSILAASLLQGEKKIANLHFSEPLNFTKGYLTHHDGLVPVLARWYYNSF